MYQYLSFSSVQFLSRVWLFATPWTAACQASLSPTLGAHSNSCAPSWWCHPIISSSVMFFSFLHHQGLQSFPSIRVLSHESVLCIRWPKYWSFSFSISPSNNTQDWFPLGLTGLISLQSKGLSSLLQHHSSKASSFQHSAFFIVPLSHPYMATGKTITLTRLTFVGKVMLLFNRLSRLSLFCQKSHLVHSRFLL